MSAISHYPAVQQINFYVNEASPELIKERRIYLENYLLPCWKGRLAEMQSWKEHSDTDLEFIAEYQSAVDYLTEALTQETNQ
ncbi:hypothetical protein F9N47_22700 [Salmonella enterica]|nr:hypothetical protein [Salmonella enterica subsp. enterica serovar Abony]EDA0855720.1 hypothetical protein [Salmonella enterica]EEH0121993.1 hypothetical protein [Salmonella enterica]EHA9223152.1 hypothetical protein [Salmonella enterica subsp. enterica serovar Abony]ELK1657274.1 hypothetical protein [Salmonella enterica]